MYFQLFIGGLTVGSCYALVALGFTLVFNATHIFNFAQGEWLMLGAMLYVTLALSAKLPLGIGIVVSVAALGIVGLCFDRIIAFAGRRRTNVITLIIITLAGGIVLKGGAQKIWGELSHNSPAIFPGDPVRLWGATLTYQHISILVITGFVIVLLYLFFNKTLLGKAARAAAFNSETAQLMGIHVRQLTALIFAMSAGLSGLAGILVSPLSSAHTGMGISLAIKGFAAAILGGAGSTVGAIAGGFFLGLIEALAGRYIASGFNAAIPFILMILVLFVRPAGFMGTREVEKV
jgi:branched-chain amino acid transport system permease protein